MFVYMVVDVCWNIFVQMVDEMCRRILNVFTLSEESGDICSMFEHIVDNVCQRIVNFYTLSAGSGNIYMMFFAQDG